jgi:hypothetical protein
MKWTSASKECERGRAPETDRPAAEGGREVPRRERGEVDGPLRRHAVVHVPQEEAQGPLVLAARTRKVLGCL